MVEVGSPPSPGGIDKRTLLIGAVLIGGVVGAFVLFSRKSQPSDTAENKAQTSAPDATTLGLAYQNLATQLLGFRGDASVASAGLQQGQSDILSAVGSGNTSLQSAIGSSQDAVNANTTANSNALRDWLTTMFGTVGTGQQDILTAVGTGQQSILSAVGSGGQDILTSIGRESAIRSQSDLSLMSQLAAVFGIASATHAQTVANSQGIADIASMNNDAYYSLLNNIRRGQGLADFVNPNPWSSYHPQPMADTSGTPGAGGATPRDSILAALGANDDADYYLAHMSAGPVRQLTKRSY